MMHELHNQARREAQRVVSGKTPPRVGTVTSYDPTNYCCKVQLQPDGNETGWIPVTSPMVGKGWGIVCPPSVGDAVEVQFQEGDPGAGFVVARFFSAVNTAPSGCPSGEFWLVHKSGSFLKFTNDGTVTLKASTFTVEADMHVTGNVTTDKDVHVTGNLTVDGTNNSMGGVNFNTHVHTDPQGGDTGGPHN